MLTSVERKKPEKVNIDNGLGEALVVPCNRSRAPKVRSFDSLAFRKASILAQPLNILLILNSEANKRAEIAAILFSPFIVFTLSDRLLRLV